MKDKITYLIEKLISEDPKKYSNLSIPKTSKERRELLRALMNVREPSPLDEEFLRIQDELLLEECESRGVVDIHTLQSTLKDPRIYLWKGDITRLNADAIVNAANNYLLGCFIPNHACIDNVIHSNAGLQLREECNVLMSQQGNLEPTGSAKITRAYNLPSKYIIHTVGPIIRGDLRKEDCEALASSYNACLDIAEANNLSSIAFCCISTGEFHFPNEEAAKIAVETIMKRLNSLKSIKKIIFDVYKGIDNEIYDRLLNA